jgi:hypothetical protein
MSAAELEAHVGVRSRAARFFRAKMLPRYLLAMRRAYRSPRLPIVACGQVGRRENSTLWLAAELQEAVLRQMGARLTFGVIAPSPSLAQSSPSSSAAAVVRAEVEDAADLRVLAGGVDGVLAAGEGASEYAALQIRARGGRVAYPSDVRRRCRIDSLAAREWAVTGPRHHFINTNGSIGGREQTGVDPYAGCPWLPSPRRPL